MSYGSDNQAIRRLLWFGCLPVAVGLGVWLGLLGQGMHTSDGKSGRHFARMDLSEVSRATGVTFPESARLLQARQIGADDSVMFAQIAISRGDVDRFIESLPQPVEQARIEPQKLREEIERSGGDAQDYPWLRMNGARECIWVTCSGTPWITIMISLDSDERATIFLCQQRT